jgi:hypothetical protein
MKILRVFFVFAILVGAIAPPKPVSAVTAPSAARHVSYVIAYEPLFGTHIPYVGWLQLTVKGGIISGTYRGLSISPDDPFVNRITPVTGGISGDAMNFNIGNGGSSLSFNGRISGNYLEGSATWRGRLYRLNGEIGRPRGM